MVDPLVEQVSREVPRIPASAGALIIDQAGRLLILKPKPNRPGGVRFLFHCGVFKDRELRAIRLQDREIDAHRFVELAEAMALLSGPLRRRVSASAGTKRCVYLEGGRPVPTVQV